MPESGQKMEKRGLATKGRLPPKRVEVSLLFPLSLQTGVDPQKVLLAKQKYLKKQEKGRLMPTHQRKSVFMKAKVIQARSSHCPLSCLL